MPPSLKDFNARREAQLERERQAALMQEQYLKQAAVKADLLMQHEGWDFFLSVLQAKLNEAKAEQFAWMEKAACALMDHDIKYAQMNHAIYRDRVALLEELIALPSKMKGAEATGQPE